MAKEDKDEQQSEENELEELRIKVGTQDMLISKLKRRLKLMHQVLNTPDLYGTYHIKRLVKSSFSDIESSFNNKFSDSAVKQKKYTDQEANKILEEFDDEMESTDLGDPSIEHDY